MNENISGCFVNPQDKQAILQLYANSMKEKPTCCLFISHTNVWLFDAVKSGRVFVHVVHFLFVFVFSTHSDSFDANEIIVTFSKQKRDSSTNLNVIELHTRSVFEIL